MGKNIIFFTLQTFSTTGGIQKMSRTLAHSLFIISQRNNWNIKVWSAYDLNRDLMTQYVPTYIFKGFGLNRADFALKTLKSGVKADLIILSHVNFSIIGILIKAINPHCKVWLIAHGIEVWRPLSFVKNLLLKRCDSIICVSNFTKEQLITRHQADPLKCVVLNNTVDPFINLPKTFNKPEHLLNRYHLTADNQVIFTLSRLASTEQYKGHDQVIKVMGKLKKKFPKIKYILAGKYDHREEIRIQKLISENEVDEQVILTGFIEDYEFTDHFLLADLFVLPSKKEGFGIVFIEALACGLPVICGNADGSVDAILNGILGKAINVDDLDELEQAITADLNIPLTKERRMYLQSQCLLHFNETNYINNLEELITNA